MEGKKERYGLSGNKLETTTDIITEYIVRGLLIVFIIGAIAIANQCGS